MKSSISFLPFILPILLCLSTMNASAMSSMQAERQPQSLTQENNPVCKTVVRSMPLKKLFDLFTAHPNAHQMTYWSHFRRALQFSLKMGYGSFCLIIHAFFPFLFETVGSDTIKELYADLTSHSKNTESRHI